jgi:uncharacterized protein YbcC (UPF0753/DUF2309 family)
MPTTKLTKSRFRSEIKQLADVVEDAVDNGAKTVEEIHKAVADLPLHMLERFDVLHQAVKDVRKVQDESIGAIYDLIRKVNHEVAKLADELLASRAVRRPSQPKLRKKV